MIRKLKAMLLGGTAEGKPRYRRPKTWLSIYQSAVGERKSTSVSGGTLVSFEHDGAFDYELYRKIQEDGNRTKLNAQWVSRGHMKTIADYLIANGKSVAFGICHGTRQGNEQKWLASALPGNPRIIGTEISSTATEFENTVQWDFHEANEEWIGACDVVYSNSWDHAYDPAKAFRAWMDSLTPGGMLFLDHSHYHTNENANELDPFGIGRDNLKAMLNQVGNGDGEVIDVLENALRGEESSAPDDMRIHTLVFRKHSE